MICESRLASIGEQTTKSYVVQVPQIGLVPPNVVWGIPGCPRKGAEPDQEHKEQC